MRAQQDGLIIHTASMAGRFIGGFPGPLYTAAKHGVVAMSHSINMQECVNGIRSCVFLPGEVATPILDKRPNPVGPEETRPHGAAAGLRRPDPLHLRCCRSGW